MKILILETSTEKSVLILAEKGVPIAVQMLSGGPSLSKNLAQETQSLLKAHSFQPNAITAGTGPGSYTGIRVGAALAQTLAYGWGIPLFGLCSLKAFAPKEQGPFAIAVDAKIGGFYTLFGERKGEIILFEAPTLISLADFLSQVSQISHIASPHPEIIQKKLATLSLASPPSRAWFETAPDPDLLAHLATNYFFEEKSPQFELTYLSHP